MLRQAEAERLQILAEECSEVIKVAMKILRHGWTATDGNTGISYDNRADLEAECGDVRAAMIRLCERGDLSKERIHHHADVKLVAMDMWTHHQGEGP